MDVTKPDHPFTVTVGTIFEDGKIPLNKWQLAFRPWAARRTLPGTVPSSISATTPAT